MSLIKVRRERKKEGYDVRKGFSIQALFFLLILVAVGIWYLTAEF